MMRASALHTRRLIILQVCIVCALACCATRASAVAYQWNTPFPTPWQDPSAWLPIGVPGAGDTATFTSAPAGMTLVDVLFLPPGPPGNAAVQSVTVESGNYAFHFSGNTLAVTGTDALKIGTGTNTAALAINQLGPGPPTVTANGTIVGVDSGSVGSLTFTGSGTTILDSGFMQIGAAGQGTLNVGSGSQVATSRSFLVGGSTAVTSHVNVTGAAATVGATEHIHLGDEGLAQILVENGGVISSGMAFQIGNGGSAAAEATVSGADSMLQAGWYLNIGRFGQGTVHVNSGAAVTAENSINLGDEVSGVGAAMVSGTDSNLYAKWSLLVGRLGKGTLNVGSAGLAKADNGIVIGEGADSSGHATISGTNSKLQAGWSIEVGSAGDADLTVSDSAMAIATNNFTIGYLAGSNGQVDVTGANSKTQSGWATVVGWHGNGTLNVNDGGSVMATFELFIGHEPTGIGEVTVGGSGASSSVTAGWYINVGRFGKGTLNVGSGGSVTTPGDINLATDPGSEGTVTIDSGGTISNGAATSVFVGGWWSMAGGKGVLNVNGGTLNIGNQLTIWNNPGNAVNFSGGTIDTGALNFYGNPSLLNWTGGTLNINNSVTFDSAAAPTTTSAAFGAARTLDAGQTLKITGNETLGGTTGTFGLTINSGGAHIVTGNLAVNHTGTLAVNSGGAATVQNALFIGESATDNTAVTVSGSGAMLNAQGWINVGDVGKGALVINGGGLATTPGIFIGANSAAIGQVDVSGTGSTLQSAWINVGTNNQGVLNISSGGLADSTTGPVTIGDTATGVGQVTVGGTNSTLRGKWISVGPNGQGTLTVNSGGLASGNADPGFVSFLVGEQTGGQGTLNVNSGGAVAAATSLVVGYGTGSSGLVTHQGSMQASSVQIGRLGTGTMNISAGGTVATGQFVLATSLGGSGIASIDGATSSVTVTGVVGTHALNLAVGQRGQGTLTMTSGATASAPVVSIGQNPGAVGQATLSSGATLQATSYLGVGTAFNPFSVPPVDIGPAGGTGTLTVNAGSSASVGTQLRIGNSGTVDLSGGGKMTVGNVGVMVPAAGSMLVGTGGTVLGTGTIVGAVVNSGGTVAPGFSPGTLHIAGNFTQTAGTLGMEIAGAGAGQFDKLDVTGNLQLGGTLQVSLLSFTPAIGNTFDLLDWTGSLSGTFGTVQLPSLPSGRMWSTAQLYTMGMLSVVSAHPGDFDGDGDVDGADFVAWQTHFPTAMGATLADGDADGDGDVDGADFVVWQTNFPYPPGPGVSPVPEPAGWVLALAAFAYSMRGFHRRRAVTGN